MDYDFAKDLARLMERPLSGVGKVSAERLSKLLFKNGIEISATYIRNLVNHYPPDNLTPREWQGLAEILANDKRYFLFMMGYYEPETQTVFKKLDNIYKEANGR